MEDAAQTLSVEPVYAGRTIRLELHDVTLPGGVRVKLEMVRHPGASAVVPVHDDGTVELIRQYRHATGARIFEVPAGKLSPGEPPEHCAARELEEETGLRAARLEPLGWIWTTPGFCDEKIHLFLAAGLTPGTLALEHDELITPWRGPLDEAVRMIRRGEIVDGKSIAALTLAWMRLRGMP